MSSGITLHGRDLSVVFGGVVAVDKLSISVTAGMVTGLVGSNGAGKTSVLNLLSGFYPSQRGEIVLETSEGSRSIAQTSVEERARLGIGRTFQTPKLFKQVSVWENVTVAQAWRRSRGWMAELFPFSRTMRRHGELRSKAIEVLRRFSLHEKADLFPSQLALGEQRLVEIARAMFGGSSLILLDEPFAGLSTQEKARLSSEIEAIQQQGIGVLLVEHNLEVVRRLANHLVVMNEGREVVHGDPAEALKNPRVIEIFLGEEASIPEPTAAPGGR